MRMLAFFIKDEKTAKRVLDSVFQDGITRSLSVLEKSFTDKLFGPALAANGPDARIAQLVEQRIENPRVGGSNPPPGTILSLCLH